MFTFNTYSTKGSVDPQSNRISMQSTVTSSVEILTASAAMNKVQETSNEKELTATSPLPKDVSCIKELVCQNGGKVRIEWNPRTGINVCLSSSEGSSISIRPENLPREFHQIKCSRGFYQFMKGLSVRLIELDNGELKIAAFHPLRGGMMQDHAHLEEAKKAFKMIKSSYKFSFSHQNNDRFAILLEALDISCGKSVGTDRQGLIHAILQHATGRYNAESFSETNELSQEISAIPTSSSESLDDNIILQHTLDFLKNRDHLEICATLVQANQDGKPVEIIQVGNKTARPVAIWKRGNEYLALTTTDYYKPTEEEQSSPIEEKTSVPDTLLSANTPSPLDLSSNGEKINPIEKAIDQLGKHLDDLKNHFVRQSVQDILREMGSFPPSQGIASFFESIILPEDSRQYIRTLNEAIIQQKREFHNNIDLLGELIKKLKVLGEKQIPCQQRWNELDMLLELDEIKKLPNETIKMVMSFISKEERGLLLEYLPEELKRAGVNLGDLNQKLESLMERLSLDSLIRKIIRRKPAPPSSLIWHRSPPDSFIGKVLSLTNPIARENHTGVISNCQRLNEVWTFTLMDESTVKIDLPSNKISLSKFRNIELCSAIVEGVIDQASRIQSDKIELICSDTKRTLINPGKYTISTKWHHLPLERRRRVNKLLRTEETQNLQLEITLMGSKNQGNYVIHMIFSKKPRKLKDLIEIKLVNLNQPLSGKVLTPYQFQDSYFIKLLDMTTLSGIDILEDVKHLQFQEEDSNTMKLYYLKIVKKKEILLRTKLLNDHHIEILEYLLDNLVSNHLKKISSIRKLAIPDDFKRSLNEIVQIYHEKLDKFDISTENILMQILIDTNYARLVDRTQSILIGKAIQLIHKSYAQISKIRHHDIILFMGNTGAGKSTGINFFLNAPLEEFQSKVGDKAVKIRDGITNPEKYPKIGQSLGTSETLYGQGYEIQLPAANPEVKKFLVDCPGFNDTRGSDYELCAALSLDQIVIACRSITCIVLVVPMQAFLVDRANPVIELVESMREIFPGAFFINTPGKTLPIHMLITKHSPDEETSFKHRISTLLLEAQEQLKQSVSDQQATETEIVNNQRRAEIWEFIAEMVKVDEERITAEFPENICVRNTLSFLNVTDTLQSRELLMWYNSSKSPIDQIKHGYVPRMQSLDLKEKLGHYVQSFAHTWCEGVVRQYSETIPNMILRLERLITESISIQASLTKDQEQNKATLTIREADKTFDEILSLELETTNIDTITQNLYASLEEKIKTSKQRSLFIVQKEIQDTQQRIEDNQSLLEEAERNLQPFVEEIESYNAIITEKRNQIQQLSEGEREILLGEFTCQSQDLLSLNTIEYRRKWRSNLVFKTIDDPNRYINENERVIPEEGRKVQANQFRGVLRHWVEIPNSYKITLGEGIKAPKSLSKKMKFWNRSKRSFGSGNRIAKVIGNETKLKSVEKIENGNRRLCFETNWTASNNLPSFRIFHLQPNRDYNAGSISNRAAEINDLNEFLIQAQRDSQHHQSTIDRIRKDRKQADQRLEKLQQEVNLLKNRLSAGLIEWRNEVKQNIQRFNDYQTTYYETLTKIEEDLEEIEDILKDYRIELHQLIRKKRNLAIIVSTQIEIASMIRAFINAILDPQCTEFAEIRALDGMVPDCKKFMQSFDTGWKKLRAECHNDLFSNHQKGPSVSPSSSSYAASSSSPSSSSSYAASSSSSSYASSSSGNWVTRSQYHPS